MKKTISILLSLIMMFSVFTVIPVVSAGALDGVGYLDENGAPQTADGVTEITSGSTALSAGWYAVTSDTEINSRITCTGDVNLILCSGATLTAHKGITVSGEDNSLTIYQQAEAENTETGKLLIDQVDDYNAGIGGFDGGSGNNITINGGTVTVTGGNYAAGIGGSDNNSGENITINGGIVTATGGDHGAGIGGGDYNSGENITVSGGTVNAIGGSSAAGIGGGRNGDGDNVTINGGTVTATSDNNAAGIGGGIHGFGENITINGGNITASSIGGSKRSSSQKPNTVYLSCTNYTDSIFANSYIGTVTLEMDFYIGTTLIPAGVLTDNGVIANKTLIPSFEYYVYIEYIDENGDTQIARNATEIASDTIELTSGWYAVTADTEISDRITCTGDVHLILCNDTTLTAHKGITVSGDDNSLTVFGQPVEENKEPGELLIDNVDNDNAGIGGCYQVSGGNIIINGGTVTVTGGKYAAGIGGGYGGSGENITVNGGTVTVSGGDYGAGIGGGDNGSGRNITINGGTVNAFEGAMGAGIGGGAYGSGENITINGGTVSATSIGRGEGIYTEVIVTLSWTNPTISIYVGSYRCKIILENDFCIGTTLIPAGVISDGRIIAFEKLTAPMNYIDENGDIQTRSATLIAKIANGSTELSEGWYAVTADTIIDNRITCTGSVNLILCNDTTLTAHMGITVSGEDNSLTIFEQPEDANKETGKLIIDQVKDYYAGIGGGEYSSGNNITINGGIVAVTGGDYGAGIGGGEYGSGNNITINGGNVTTSGGVLGSGIGGGWKGSGKNITINGGTVKATGGIYAAGIGDGYQSSGGTITLSWTNPSVIIYASSYNGTVTLEKDFFAELTFIPAGDLIDNGVIADKTLTPSINYIDENGDTSTAKAALITNDTTELNAGWYVVPADIQISDRITCNGNVHLILFDGTTLTVPKGIAVNDNDRLTIYGQAVGDGTLLITGSGSDYNAGLGGDEGCSSGVITINSGTVSVNIDNSSAFGAAIGGGESGEGFVNINGGTVRAYTSSGLGASIGGSDRHSGYVVIKGGNVTASSIGGGERGGGSTLLSWTNGSDSIKADSYVGSVTLDKDFRADSALTPSGSVIDKSTIAGKTLTPPGFIGHSLTLSGDIGINYFTLLTDAELGSGAVVDFLWTVEGEEKTYSVTLTAEDLTDNGYKATCPVAVAEMTYDVTATLTVDGEELATDTYSVKRYADTILSSVYKTKYIASGYTEERYEKLAALIKTMLDYGTKAQINFNRNTGNLANAGVDYTMAAVTPDMIPSTASDMESGLDDYGLAYAGTTIVYLTKTSMRHYYNITDQAKFDLVKDNITFNGEKVEYKTKNGQIYFELTDIAAADLDTPYTLSIGTNDYQYSALDYVRACLESVYVPYATAQLVSATYWYNQAANDYFGR